MVDAATVCIAGRTAADEVLFTLPDGSEVSLSLDNARRSGKLRHVLENEVHDGSFRMHVPSGFLERWLALCDGRKLQLTCSAAGKHLLVRFGTTIIPLNCICRMGRV